MVPDGLRRWFVIHCIVDVLFAVPLLIAPRALLTLFSGTQFDPFTARLVAAALFGIGLESYLGRNAGVEAMRGMLNLKIIWSAFAVIGMSVTLLSGQGPRFGWVLVAIFLAFNVLWGSYRLRLR